MLYGSGSALVLRCMCVSLDETLPSGFYRSCERSLRSLDQESPPKKKKLQPAFSSTTHLLAGKKCPSSLQTKSNDIETTVFYIPGVDVKVSVYRFPLALLELPSAWLMSNGDFSYSQLHYNSKTLKTESPNASRGSSLPRTLSKESKLYGMKDSGPSNPPNAVQSKTNSLLPPPPPPIPSGTEHSLIFNCMPYHRP